MLDGLAEQWLSTIRTVKLGITSSGHYVDFLTVKPINPVGIAGVGSTGELVFNHAQGAFAARQVT